MDQNTGDTITPRCGPAFVCPQLLPAEINVLKALIFVYGKLGCKWMKELRTLL